MAAFISSAVSGAPFAASALRVVVLVARSATKPPASVPTDPAATVMRPKVTLARPASIP